jgi:membrane protease YdiL (CAAX protease family)
MAEEGGGSVSGSPTPLWRRVLVGPGGLRAGWRLLLFMVVFAAVSSPLVWLALRVLGSEDRGWTPPVLATAETISLLAAVVAIVVLGRLERRTFADYGVPFRRALASELWWGSLVGLVMIAATVGLIALSGGYTVRGLALHGADLAVYALAWAGVFLLVALFEEIAFRGYMLYTLSSGIGFWPAAVLLSAYFGFVLHYLAKPGETWVDGLSTTLLGLFLCLTVERTGNVWYAVGWHFTFNFGSMFVFASPNTGNNGHPLPGHLLDASFHGPQWLTGGAMGVEASAFVFVVLAVVTAVFLWRHREVRYVLARPAAPAEALGAA